MSKNLEIERKFLLKELPELTEFKKVRIEQGYMSKNPVLRIRRMGEEYFLTYKGEGLLAREEYEFPISEEAYEHLLPKCDGRIIKKDRYYIPLDTLMIELDVFLEDLSPLILAEVEFSSPEEAGAFIPPDYFGEDVTEDAAYHNSNMIDGAMPFSKYE